MLSFLYRGAISLGAVAALMGAASVSSCGSSSSSTSGPVTVRVVGGQPQGGVRQIRIAQGQTADITVKSDVAEEIHIHGYELHQEVPRDGSVHFRFRASTQGTFVIELEKLSRQIASLQVFPR